jgi:hypothetical protein
MPRTRTPDADRRAAGRARWDRWAARDRAGKAFARGVEYDGRVLGKLIEAGWLTPGADVYPRSVVGGAVSDLLAQADLPKKKDLPTRWRR